VGPPAERPHEKVRDDVREGLVTRESAREVYGVEVDP
jgi:N-methylhydantoinase B/oxoprolinase/acetone carboxylase alpha subunit